MQIENIDVSLESVNMASVCNKAIRKFPRLSVTVSAMKRDLSTSSMVSYIRLYLFTLSDITILGGNTNPEIWTMTKSQRMNGAGYTVEVVWECQLSPC